MDVDRLYIVLSAKTRSWIFEAKMKECDENEKCNFFSN